MISERLTYLRKEKREEGVKSITVSFVGTIINIAAFICVMIEIFIMEESG